MTQHKLNWFNITFFSLYTSALFIFLPVYLWFYQPSALLLILTFITFVISGLGVTAGYHRYFSHQCFNTNAFVESCFLVAGTLGTVNSALMWSHDHRLHHRYVDQERDPYNFQKGFFWAHIGWVMTDEIEYQPKIVQDLTRNPRVVWQHKFYLPLTIAANLLSILSAGYLCNDYFGATVFVFLLRLFCLHHCTFAINSFAHYIGSQPFSSTSSAVNNWIVSLFTFGEGNHNYHHEFSYDYRNGPLWFNFDPTKWLIWALNKVGLVTHLKRVDSYKFYKAMLNQRTDKLLSMIDKKYAIRGDFQKLLILRVNQKSLELNQKIEELRETVLVYNRLRKEWLANQASFPMITQERLKTMKRILKTHRTQFKLMYKHFHMNQLLVS